METLSAQTNKPLNPERKDEVLWNMAKKRASFKWAVTTYLIMNCFFVAVWYYSSGINSYFWPIWPMLGWGLGVAFRYFSIYHRSQIFTAEEEYEKLKSKHIR